MFEKFTSRDAGDFRQRYLGTYGYFKRGDKRVLAQITNVNTEAKEKYLEFIDANGVKFLLIADRPDDSIGFEFLPPKMAYHNTDLGCLLMSRIPARQYYRGICDKNIKIRTPMGTNISVNFPVLQALYTSKITPKEALDSAIEGFSIGKEGSFALSPFFAACLSTKYFYCLDKAIGTVKLKDKRLVISLKDKEKYFTEIKDACFRNQIDVEFV